MRVLTANEIDLVSAEPRESVDSIPAVVIAETLHRAGPAIPPHTFLFPTPFVLPEGV